MDHPVVDLYYKDKNNNSLKHINPRGIADVFRLVQSAYEYLVHQRGPLVSSVTYFLPSSSTNMLISQIGDQIGEGVAFIRSDDPQLFPEKDFPNKVKDSTSGDDGPDMEIFSTSLAYKVCV
jgi:choline dehydrogenase